LSVLLAASVALLLPLTAVVTAAPAQAATAKPAGLSSSSTATSPVLKWKPVKKATSYRVEVSDTSTFGRVLFGVTTTNVQATPTTVLPLGKLYWRVQAKSASGTSKWAKSSFTRTMRDGPVLVGPSDGVTLEQPESPPVLKWNPVPGARYYEIELDGVEHDWVDTTTYKTETTSFVVREPQPNGTYWWRIRAVLATGVNTKYSDEWTYSIGALRSVVLPETSETMDGDVVLEWDPVPGAVAYEIRVSTDNGFNKITDQRTVAGTRYSPQTTYDNTSYWWQVRARNALGQSEEWPSFPDRTGEFRRKWSDAPTLIYPAEGSTPGADFYYQWSPTRLATTYSIDVGTDPGFSNTKFFDTCTTTQTTLTIWNVTDQDCAPVVGGKTYWRVQAIDGPQNVNGIFSAVGSFTYTPPAGSSSPTGVLPDVTGERLTLDGNGSRPCTASLATGTGVCAELSATPMLDWDPVPGAAYYRIYLSHDREFTNMVSGYGDSGSPNTLPSTADTRWIPVKALPDTQAGEAYYWYIRPCKADHTCGLTPLQASNAFEKKSVPVNLLAPTAGATVADQVTFHWSDYLETNRTFTDRSEQRPGQAAKAYRIQVSDTETFAKLIDNEIVDQTTYTAFERSYPEGAMWWRVQAIDGSGNYLTWSAPRPFTKSSPTPKVISPTDGQAINGVQAFRWEALDYAKYYDLEVYRNNDTTASSVNKALWATNIRQTAFTADKPLEALGQDFVWRIRRSDFSGNKSAWGPWHKFRVTAAAPRLAKPGAGSKINGKKALFTWASTAEATSFVWELRKGTSVVKRVATASTNYAPTWAIAKGKWKWRVTAMNSRGKVLKSTSWRGFKAS
jgi:hypothetical protein